MTSREWLAHPAAHAVSLLLFALGGRALADLAPLPSPALREALAVGLTCLGPLGVAIEVGAQAPLAPAGALAVGLWAALSHAAAAALLPMALLLGSWPAPSVPGWRDLPGPAVVLVLGALLARLGPRLDRGEAGWREAVRLGPPHGTSPLAWRIAATRLPRPLGLLLLPLDLPLRALLLGSIAGYQLTASRLMPPACRFEPTCSRYGFGAVCRHGAVRGTLLTGLRLLRCSPLSDGGHDPVPEAATVGGLRYVPGIEEPPR